MTHEIHEIMKILLIMDCRNPALSMLRSSQGSELKREDYHNRRVEVDPTHNFVGVHRFGQFAIRAVRSV